MPVTATIALRDATPDDLAAMAEISVAARSRYRAIPQLNFLADSPAVAAQRFREANAIVAVTTGQMICGFVLTRPMDGLLLLDNISTSPNCRGQGVGNLLLRAVLNEAKVRRYPAVILTTFRDPPWNGPWFRRYEFTAMPDDKIGPALRALIEHQSTYLDPGTRETLWRPFR